jgi:hypothetical protein
VKDGINYAALTVQLSGGEQGPFLFMVKELVAEGRIVTQTIADGWSDGRMVGQWPLGRP